MEKFGILFIVLSVSAPFVDMSKVDADANCIDGEFLE